MNIKERNRLAMWALGGLGIYLLWEMLEDKVKLPQVTNTGNIERIIRTGGVAR